MNRIAYLGTYVPKRCGIATYTHHLRQSVRAAKGWKGIDPVLAVSDRSELDAGYDAAIWPLVKEERLSYRKAADKINASDVALVSLQHEFGIFGGQAGAYVLDFLERLKKPVVTTFHTVFEHPQEPYRSIQQQIADRSDRILVMSREAIRYVADSFAVPEEKVRFIPHGTPVPVLGKRHAVRDELGWTGRKVVMSFGLLSRGKGLETVLRALPAVVREVPETLYAIVGQTHPEVRKTEGESYREELRALVAELGLAGHVEMIDRYMDEQELVACLTACDLYVTPYPGLQQITSGTLAYAVGLGRPVLSTPYVYAQDLLRGYEELLVPALDVAAWERKLTALLSDRMALQRWERRMARIGADMHWPHVGLQHWRLFKELIREAAMDRQAVKG
ncbi:glycosyltransferase family 4 protein [Paenibacillus hamazuiensis]|uniref:glycosyltransferase family 4 protein n=1 Tax=Paenibacillus hamazuiensis TaxID=2936508 RepID=UPI00200D3C9C|nr:glycosyltransferase family 4 protein [Paenibacillus hamazuiensis]